MNVNSSVRGKTPQVLRKYLQTHDQYHCQPSLLTPCTDFHFQCFQYATGLCTVFCLAGQIRQFWLTHSSRRMPSSKNVLRTRTSPAWWAQDFKTAVTNNNSNNNSNNSSNNNNSNNNNNNNNNSNNNNSNNSNNNKTTAVTTATATVITQPPTTTTTAITTTATTTASTTATTPTTAITTATTTVTTTAITTPTTTKACLLYSGQFASSSKNKNNGSNSYNKNKRQQWQKHVYYNGRLPVATTTAKTTVTTKSCLL